MRQLSFVAGLAVLVSAGAFGQGRMRMHPGGPPPGGGDFAFVRPEFGVSGRVVKGAPYSAQAVTEFTQTLADGNRIQRNSSTSVARDSEGRTRTEQSMRGIGALNSSNGEAKAVFIHDPVAGTSYVLDPSNRTARQGAAMRQRDGGGDSAAIHQRQSPAGDGTNAARGFTRRGADTNRKTEDLGTQVMEGLSVQGKRITRTIPAGQFGNEKAMEIVTETWYSPDLQTVVMSKTTDPRMGESVFKLTNINRGEPDPTLFQVPGDYSVTRGGGRAGMQMRRQPQAQQ